jgi:hypothetical protein
LSAAYVLPTQKSRQILAIKQISVVELERNVMKRKRKQEKERESKRKEEKERESTRKQEKARERTSFQVTIEDGTAARRLVGTLATPCWYARDAGISRCRDINNFLQAIQFLRL